MRNRRGDDKDGIFEKYLRATRFDNPVLGEAVELKGRHDGLELIAKLLLELRRDTQRLCSRYFVNNSQQRSLDSGRVRYSNEGKTTRGGEEYLWPPIGDGS